jgi:hypothetical protein
VQQVISVDFLGLMLQQISTPWDMCLKELFLNDFIRSAAVDNDLSVLKRSGIKALVDQLHQAVKRGRFYPKILELLGYVCTPGGRTDRRI